MTDLYQCQLCGDSAETLIDHTCEDCIAEEELADSFDVPPPASATGVYINAC